MFLCSIAFKSITLWLAICIFTTNTSFKWDEIENHFTSIDSARDFFLAMILFISFSDICLDIAVLSLKFIVIGRSAVCKDGKWYENISALLCPKRDKHFNRTCFDENKIFQHNPWMEIMLNARLFMHWTDCKHKYLCALLSDWLSHKLYTHNRTNTHCKTYLFLVSCIF